MIMLPVDEAYALDYYAIVQVKLERGLPVSQEIARLDPFLVAQLPNLTAILGSREYFALLAANRATFDAIDWAHRDKISASDVQRVNQKRFRAKRRLQAKFWPNSKLSEQKTNP